MFKLIEKANPSDTFEIEVEFELGSKVQLRFKEEEEAQLMLDYFENCLTLGRARDIYGSRVYPNPPIAMPVTAELDHEAIESISLYYYNKKTVKYRMEYK